MNDYYENQVNITQSKDENTLTFQVKGNADFVERMTDKAMAEYFKLIDTTDSHIKGFDKVEGYIGEGTEYTTPSESKDEPDYYQTGIKDNRFRCHYICSHCQTKENKYINNKEKYIRCRACNSILNVHWYEREYGIKTDRFNNFACAGDYIPRDIV